MGELVEAAKALSAPATKLIEVVSRGIGKGYDPRYKKRMADATAYEIDTIAGAIRRNGDVPILFDREGVQLDARSAQDLIERTGMRLFSQEVRKQQNIEAIVDKAYEELKNEESVSNEPVDEDWIVRFFNSVEDVSNEKLQEIWAKILAGEIKKPRSSSLRTLDLLKNQSVNEAILFEKVSSCIIRSGEKALIPNEPDLWKAQDVKFSDLIALSDAGIINLSLVSLTLYISDVNNVLYNDFIMGALRSSSENSPKSIGINVYVLTEAGRDLIRASKSDKHRCRDFSLSYFRKLKNEKENVAVFAYDVLSIDNNNITHGLVNLIH